MEATEVLSKLQELASENDIPIDWVLDRTDYSALKQELELLLEAGKLQGHEPQINRFVNQVRRAENTFVWWTAQRKATQVQTDEIRQPLRKFPSPPNFQAGSSRRQRPTQ